jgi:Transglycosylase SLT domain
MLEATLTQLIDAHPDRGDMPIACVKAVCMVESSFNEWAHRYEPTWKWFIGTEDTLTATERIDQMSSFGLMQIMGGVARDYGYTGYLTKLCDPATGLRYGMLHLRKYFEKYGEWHDTLSAYNAGSPRKGPDGQYLNQAYVSRVMQYWAQFERGDI